MRLIAGSGRSGTTWVLDSLAAANNLRPVFEPLNPYASSIGNQYAHRTLAPDESHPDLQRFMEDACTGRQKRLWMQFRRHRHWLLPPLDEFRSVSGAAKVGRRWGRFLREAPGLAYMSTRRDPLVKCIWANLMLGWLSRHFDCPILLVVRHPGAVIESELRGDWSAEGTLERFRADPKLHELTNGRYRDLLERRLTPIESLALRWVIENQWVIESAPANGATVVFYERLRSSPDRAWDQVLGALDLQNAPDAATLARPSQQSAPAGSGSTGTATGQALWQRILTSDQKDQIQGVLDAANFDLYSMSAAEPRETKNRMALAGASGAGR